MGAVTDRQEQMWNKKAAELQPGNRMACSEASSTATQFGAGEEGFEPSHAGIKIRCLNQLGDSPTSYQSNTAMGALEGCHKP